MTEWQKQIAGGGALFVVLCFLANHVWQRTEAAWVLAMDVDARQQKLEAIVERQDEYNRRLLTIIENAKATPTPGLRDGR